MGLKTMNLSWDHMIRAHGSPCRHLVNWRGQHHGNNNWRPLWDKAFTSRGWTVTHEVLNFRLNVWNITFTCWTNVYNVCIAGILDRSSNSPNCSLIFQNFCTNRMNFWTFPSSLVEKVWAWTWNSWTCINTTNSNSLHIQTDTQRVLKINKYQKSFSVCYWYSELKNTSILKMKNKQLIVTNTIN